MAANGNTFSGKNRTKKILSGNSYGVFAKQQKNGCAAVFQNALAAPHRKLASAGKRQPEATRKGLARDIQPLSEAGEEILLFSQSAIPQIISFSTVPYAKIRGDIP